MARKKAQQKPTKQQLRRRWFVFGALGAVVAAVGAWLVFGVFAFHLRFVTDVAEDENVVLAGGGEASGDQLEALLDEAMEDQASGSGTATTLASDGSAAPTTAPASAPDDGTDTATTATTEPAVTATTSAEPELRVVALGELEPRSHPGEGVVAVLTDGTQTLVRFSDDFRTDNGPDLDVYLSTAAPAADVPAGEFDDDFVNLGDLKGNVGGQTYEVPAGTDLSRYKTVVVWCVRFGVAFTAADLTSVGG